MSKWLTKYEQHFGDIKSLYDYQEIVLNLLSSKQNTLAIIPTGGGKSLIFQLMALELDGVTIVISPLLALMKEQVDELNQRGIPALALNSDIPFNEQRKILRELKSSPYKLIYLSPERLQNYLFRACLLSSGINIPLIVVDEAHCISQWGGSFRPEYSLISEFVKFLNENNKHPFIFGLTATLANQAREDIIQELAINKKNTFVYKKILRENLNLEFQKVNLEVEKESCLSIFLEKYKPSKTVIYLFNKHNCEKYTKYFAKKGFSANYFHADLDKDEKRNIYNSFINNEIQLLFATSAFGLGINIPDIESIVHYEIPHSVEEYYQQVGRGWRNKIIPKSCNCLAMWSDENFKVRRRMIEHEKQTLERIYNNYKKVIGNAKIKSVGQIVNKDKESLLNSEENLQLLRYKLEQKGIIQTLGELNGSPKTIKLKKNTNLWSDILNADDDMDSFIYVSRKLNIPIQDIIKHLYEQEMNDNIKSVPAKARQLFFKVNHLELPNEIAIEIMNEINEFIDSKIYRLEELRRVYDSKNPLDLISLTLK